MAGSSIGSAIGASLPRLEDARLLTGGGCYSDDFTLPGQAYAWVVRSPHAHARIVSIDTSDARAMPGVLTVLTGADVLADGLKPVPHIPAAMSPPDIKLPNTDGSPHKVVRPDVLAIETACFVGEPVAFVVAETLALAKDAAEAVQVDYAALPPLAEIVVDSLVGDQAATPAAFAQARHVVKLRADIQRVTGVPMEPRAALGHFDAASGRYTLYAGGGAIVRPKKEVAIILGIEPERVRVIAREVGGNFGTRNFFYPEFALVCWASRKTGRPVKWTCERHEAFLSDYAGRDFLIESELALDADGSFLGLRAISTSNLGAYTASFVPLTKGTQLMTSLYRMPAMAQARGVLSNTPSTAPYRSAGRPEAMFVIERLIDLAARAHGFDRIALRRRNLITTTPHTNAFGVTYDSGDYRATLDAVLKLADWKGFARRRATTAARGLRRGIGLGGYVESQSGAPAERAEVTVLPEGLVEIVIGTLSAGQGHATSFAQLASEWLGVPADKVRLVTDDSDRLSVGGGSHSGRSIRLAATTIHQASLGIIAQGRKLAAQLLEASRSRYRFRRGPLHHRRHRPRHRPSGAGGRARADRRSGRCREPGRLLSLRLACLRGRGRCRDRRGPHRPLHHDRRCRPRGEPADPARPDPWRHRPGRGPGADGALLLRTRRPAPVGLVHGLRHAARRRLSVVHDGAERGAVDQPCRWASAAAARAASRRRWA